MTHEIPTYLFCYFNIDSGLDFLRTQRFRLSSISEFNDPFESLFKTDYPHYFLSLGKDCSDNEIDKRVDILDEKELFVCKNIVRNKSKGRVDLINKLRVGCFSEVGDNILMWGHYGRKFTGIVVKFQISFGDWGNDLHKVEYCNERIAILEFDTDRLVASATEWQLLLRKSREWEYEKEWRYIQSIKACTYDNHGAFKQINKSAIKEVIVGKPSN